MISLMPISTGHLEALRTTGVTLPEFIPRDDEIAYFEYLAKLSPHGLQQFLREQSAYLDVTGYVFPEEMLV